MFIPIIEQIERVELQIERLETEIKKTEGKTRAGLRVVHLQACRRLTQLENQLSRENGGYVLI